MVKRIELNTGDRFGLWTVIKRGSSNKRGAYRWLCKCQCGKIKEVSGVDLRRGHSRSCRSCGGKNTPAGSENSRWTGCGEISGKHWDTVLRHAKRRGLPVEITIQDAWSVFLSQDRKCALSGVELKFGKGRTASLDRIDSSLGYTPTNIQWVHKRINQMKSNMSDKELLNWCQLIVDRQISVSY